MESKTKNIEELILNHLQKGSVVILKLIELIKKDRPNTTKQGIYATLRKLKKEEKVLIHNSQASLNIKWVQTMSEYFTKTQYYYTHHDTGDGSFISLDDGEKIEYYFQNPIVADTFWTHALYILLDITPQQSPLFIYNPHEWFLIARRENETAFIKDTKEKNRILLVTAGNKNPLDKAVLGDFDGTTSQYYMSEKMLFKKKNYYINTLGDFIIEVWIDKLIAEKIEEVYKKTKKLNEEAKEELIKILGMKGKTKIVISRNNKKSERLQKMLRKYFYIPKQSILDKN